MNITERILETISKISNKTGIQEEDVSWRQIATELATELNNINKLNK